MFLFLCWNLPGKWFLQPNVQDNRTRPSQNQTEARKLQTRTKLEKEPKGGFRFIVELGLFFTTDSKKPIKSDTLNKTGFRFEIASLPD
jgi:hypothetical protein